MGFVFRVRPVRRADRLIRYMHISIKASIGPALAFSQDGRSTQIQAINISQNCALAIQIRGRAYVYLPLRTLPTHPRRFHVSRSRRLSDRTAFSSRISVDSCVALQNFCRSRVTTLQGIRVRPSQIVSQVRGTYVRRFPRSSVSYS